MSQFSANQFGSLVEVLRWHSDELANDIAVTFLVDGEDDEQSLTYRELDQHARAIGAWLQDQGAQGERVLLLYPPGLEYVTAYLGCLYAGAIAVPAYPPRRREPTKRLESVVTDCDAKFMFTTQAITELIHSRFEENSAFSPMRRLVTEDIPLEAADAWKMPTIKLDDIAFLQYTSGSTSAPKGVMVTHGNLMSNEHVIEQAYEHVRPVFISWLPMYHDMGLIGNLLQPLYTGGHTIVMSPTAFVQRPYRWLKAVSKYRCDTTGGPNFGYELCTTKITEEEKSTLDLSSWSIAYNGAEPIRADTLREFSAAFESCGFSEEAFYPCYGLAEATLFVTGGPKGHLPTYATFDSAALEKNQVREVAATDKNARELVGCGPAWGQIVKTVNPDTLAETQAVGEIWIHGGNIAKGYWGNPQTTADTFGAYLPDGEGPFLRTGDLGFVQDDKLFVTGRIKDLVIIRGRNHYPQDIELTVERSHPALRPGCGAAFSIDVNGEEQLVILQEIEREHRMNFDADAIFSAIVSAVMKEHQIPIHAIALLNTLSIMKTSSGKIQRRANRQAFLENTLETIATWTAPKETPAPAKANGHFSAAQVERWIMDWMATNLQISRARITRNKAFAEYGMDSIKAVEFAQALDTWLEGRVVLDEITAWDFPTISELTDYIVRSLSGEHTNGGNGNGAHSSSPQNLNEVSDDEIARLLSEEIKALRNQS
jgi:acyl-CoA synthetase (AMP-forming)/AMP-acid ligase II/acyl carrier protein